MLWVFFGLSSMFLWAIANIFDKRLRSHYLHNSFALTAAFGLGTFALTLILFSLKGVTSMPTYVAMAAIGGGVLTTAGVLLYIKALSLEEASRVVPLFHLEPLIILVLAVIFLSEVLSLQKYIAFALILLGGFLISIRRLGSTFHISPAVGVIVVSSVLFAVAAVVLKYAYSNQNFWNVFILFGFGLSITQLSIFILKSARSAFIKTLQKSPRPFLALLTISVIFGYSGSMMFGKALATGPVTIISVFIGFQSLFVLLIATLLTLKHPTFIKETITPKIFVTKLFAIALMIGGLFLLQF